MYSCVAFNTCCFFAGWLLKLLLRKWNDIPGYFYLYLGLFFCLLSSFFSLFSLPFLYGPHKFDLMHVVMSNMYISLGGSHLCNFYVHPFQNLFFKLQVCEPFRASISGAPLEDARHLTRRYDRVRQEFDAQVLHLQRQ